MTRWLYFSADLTAVAEIRTALLSGIEERDAVDLDVPPLVARGPEHLPGDYAGIVLAMDGGRLGAGQKALAAEMLSRDRVVFLHWPREGAVERLDRERLELYARIDGLAWWWSLILPLRGLYRSIRSLRGMVGLAAALWRGGRAGLARELLVQAGADIAAFAEIDRRSGDEIARHMLKQAEDLATRARPVPLPRLAPGAGGLSRLDGHGVYLRLDFWVSDISGGGIGHTSYVIKALRRVSEHLTVFASRSYDLVERLGIPQVVIPGLLPLNDERTQLRANEHHYALLRAAFQSLRPAYVYERVCPGSFVGARLCAELNIPYIVEYNGSEIAMAKAFGAAENRFEPAFLAAESASFAVASLISVVSEVVRDDLVSRGVDPARILVNPNGADPEDYRPPEVEERAALRTELGIGPDCVVIGFTGTFGGWHGIDILAEVIALVCAEEPKAVFLLIGDGAKKPLVDEVVARHGLENRVIRTGRVPQAEGARLLRACDAFVSTHAGGIGAMRFFGSPTKIFEYMALGQGIVATDLEQIGEVLSPCLRPGEAGEAGSARAVLCPPNQARPVADALIALVRDPQLRQALGRNARQALLEHYSWDRHVERLWQQPSATPAKAVSSGMAVISSHEAYKAEAQRLWNREACGSQYIQGKTPDSLEWFLEHERLRLEQFYPWMASEMAFEHQGGRDVLEIGAGIGTDLVQFAKAGARVTDLDLSAGHLALARRNFELRGLPGSFVHHDAEALPFPDASFDLVYSFGVIHHSPRTQGIVHEIRRILRPGGRAIITVYAEESTNFWWRMVWGHGLRNSGLERSSIGEIMSCNVEMSERGARPLVKVYSRQRLSRMFQEFRDVSINTRHCPPHDRPLILRPLPDRFAERHFGWFHIVKAVKA